LKVFALTLAIAATTPRPYAAAVLSPHTSPPARRAAVAQVPETVAVAARRLVATLELAAQEYRLAWHGDVLVNPAEWQEARLFLAEARRSVQQLPPGVRSEMQARLVDLERRLAAQLPADAQALEAGEIERRSAAAIGVSLDEQPAREPSIANGELLYRSTCTRCHGLEGRGDGPVTRAGRLNPAPANLADPAQVSATTPLDLYRKISLGVPGTRMQPFGEALSREERWDLVAYLLTLSDSAARRGLSGAAAVAFAATRGTLASAREEARRGDREAAGRKAFDAYLAFESVEGNLRATDPGLVRRAEAEFAAFREAAATLPGQPVLEERYARLFATLAEAETALTRSRSAAGYLAESFLLIVREGFEAILVIGAIMAVVLKAGARHRRRNVRWGITAALAASLLTAAALEWLFRVTPAQREALEGGVMLLAAGVLFYVSYWLISKLEIAAWTRFVKDRIGRAVESGSGLALGGVAFLAVYREGFETVLFYKALYVTGGASGTGPITVGLLAGLATLIVVFVGIKRFGLRIPMRPFFAVTGATLAYLAFVFAGDGVKELQEGGYVASTLVPHGPRNEFLGVYPTWESLALQGLMLSAILGAVIWTFAVRSRRIAAQSGSAGSRAGTRLPPGIPSAPQASGASTQTIGA
jgi:high-affinity iron transporter